MRFLLVLLQVLFLCLPSVGTAQSCLSKSSPKTKFIIENDSSENSRINISSNSLQCSNSLTIKSKNKNFSLALRSGKFKIRITAPQCKILKKSFTIKRKSKKLKFKLKCSESNTRNEDLPQSEIDRLRDLIDPSLNSIALSQHVESLTYEEVFNLLNDNDISNILRAENAIDGNIDIKSILSERGVDSLKLKLNSAGLLTASTSILGTQRIKYLGELNPRSDVLVGLASYEKIKSKFHESKLRFLLNLSTETLRAIFLRQQSDLISEDPILLVTNELIPSLLGGASNHIVRRFALTLDFASGAKADTWNLNTLAGLIRNVDASKRSYLITFTAGSPVTALDPLLDNHGNVIDKFPNIPYRFPSYDLWKQRVSQNLSSYLTEIKNAYVNQGGLSSLARNVAIDFESIRNDWESTVLYFEGQHALLLEDPRIIPLKEKLRLSDDDIRSMHTWLPSDPRRLRWDSYMLQQRAEAISFSVGETFRNVFDNQNITTSNYDDTLRSDMVPNGAFEKKEFRIWGSLGTNLNNSAPSIPLYGLQYQRLSTPEGEILSTPPAPSIINQVSEIEYNTRSNTFVSTLNRVNSISSATSLKTNHYVTVKDFIDTWHDGYYGSCMRYQPSSGRFKKIVCNESEGMGGFMFEYWALAAQNSKYLNLYTLSTNLLPITLEQARFAEHSMSEINRMLGFSDRSLAKDAFVYLDGVRTTISSTKVEYGKPFYVWASRANNKIVYRVVFMAPNNFDKKITLIRDGSSGDGVQISYNGSFLEIPGGVVDLQSLADESAPFGFFITQDINFNKLN